MLSHFITVNHIAVSGCPALNVSECEAKDTKGFREKKGNSCLWKATCEVDCRGENDCFKHTILQNGTEGWKKFYCSQHVAPLHQVICIHREFLS